MKNGQAFRIEAIWTVGILYKTALLFIQKGLQKPKSHRSLFEWRQPRPRSPDGLCPALCSSVHSTPAPVPRPLHVSLPSRARTPGHFHSLRWCCPARNVLETWSHTAIPSFFKKDFYLFIFREEGRKEKEEKERSVASHRPPAGDQAHNPGMCLAWELNQGPFGLQAGTQSAEPHQPDLHGHHFFSPSHPLQGPSQCPCHSRFSCIPSATGGSLPPSFLCPSWQ